MYGWESWTIKRAECQRTDDFELWCWRRHLRIPWTTRRSNQSILKEISPEYSLEGLMLKLKIQYFGHLMQRTASLEMTLMLGKIEGDRDNRGWSGWMASPAWWTWVWASSGTWWWTEKPGVLQSMGLQRVRHEWVLNWTELKEVEVVTLRGNTYLANIWREPRGSEDLGKEGVYIMESDSGLSSPPPICFVSL